MLCFYCWLKPLFATVDISSLKMKVPIPEIQGWKVNIISVPDQPSTTGDPSTPEFMKRNFHHGLWTSPLLLVGMSIKNQNRMTNSIDPEEAAHDEPPNQDLHCLQRYLAFFVGPKDWKFICFYFTFQITSVKNGTVVNIDANCAATCIETTSGNTETRCCQSDKCNTKSLFDKSGAKSWTTNIFVLVIMQMLTVIFLKWLNHFNPEVDSSILDIGHVYWCK